MTNKKENPQNSSVNFKLKLIKVAKPRKLGKGLYEQMRNGNRVQYSKLDESQLRQVMEELFYGKNKK